MLHTAGGHFGSGDVFVASGYGVDSRASVAESSRFIGDSHSPLSVPWIVVICIVLMDCETEHNFRCVVRGDSRRDHIVQMYSIVWLVKSDRTLKANSILASSFNIRDLWMISVEEISILRP